MAKKKSAKKSSKAKAAKPKAKTARAQRTQPKAASPSAKKSASKKTSSSKIQGTITLEDILSQLKALGEPGVRAQNAKSGAGDNQFGVKRGDLRKLADKLKRQADHELALSLWKTGNIDAQFLATLLIDVGRLSAEELDRMVRSVGFAWVADWLHSYVTKEHAEKETLRNQWMTDPDRWAARAGWALTAGRVAKRPEGLDLAGLLDRIEQEMAGAAPEVQWTMNSCLAEIGIRFPKLRKRAIAIGERLGIYRDYPCAKGCTSPFAPIWIGEMVRRQG